MRVCVPITAEGQVDPRWGRADRVAVASVVDGQIAGWQEFTVGWGQLHDEGSEDDLVLRGTATSANDRAT
jgi:hypothetical protein